MSKRKKLIEGDSRGMKPFRTCRLFVLLVPFLLGMVVPASSMPQQQVKILEPTVDWTLVLVAGFGALGACVPAYYGYKSVKRRRACKRED